MSYISKNLLANEQILHQSRLHRIIFLAPAVLTIVTLILLALSSILKMLAFVTGVLAVVYWFSSLISYKTAEYVLTNKRVLIKIGFFRRRSLEIFLQKVEGIQVNQNITGRLFRYGTITIIGTGGTQNSFPLINQPLVFRRYVQTQIEKVMADMPMQASSQD